MEKNLFEQAKEMMDDFMNDTDEHGEHAPREQDKKAVRNAIQAAYNDAKPEEEQQLRQLEQHLDSKGLK